MKRRQRALASGNRPPYKWYRNRVNRARKNLQRVYYQSKVGALQSQQHKKWWSDIKQMSGLKSASDSLQGLVNTHCSGNVEPLASNISKFLSSVTENFLPLSEEDCFVPEESMAESWLVPERLIIRVEEV